MLPLKKQGDVLVQRDNEGKVVAKALSKVARGVPIPLETWRKTLSRLTNGGEDILVALIDLAQGNPFVPPPLSDGRQFEPIIPSPEVRRAALMNLHEMLRGKSVAETEVRAAEDEASKKLQLESLSTEQLKEYLVGEFKVIDGGKDEG